MTTSEEIAKAVLAHLAQILGGELRAVLGGIHVLGDIHEVAIKTGRLPLIIQADVTDRHLSLLVLADQADQNYRPLRSPIWELSDPDLLSKAENHAKLAYDSAIHHRR